MYIPTGHLEKLQRGPQTTFLPRSAWEEQLDRFLEALNPGRAAEGFAPYSHARLARILSKAGVNDADAAFRLFRKCETGRSFSRLFSYLTKP